MFAGGCVYPIRNFGFGARKIRCNSVSGGGWFLGETEELCDCLGDLSERLIGREGNFQHASAIFVNFGGIRELLLDAVDDFGSRR